jgi:hypothetical protein
MSSLSSSRSSTPFVLENVPYTRMKKAIEATNQEPTIPLGATNLVIPNDSQLSLSSRYLDILAYIRMKKTTKLEEQGPTISSGVIPNDSQLSSSSSYLDMLVKVD